MAIYELQSDKLEKLPRTSFGQSGIKERQDLQRILRAQLDVICPDTLILGEEYGGWDESRRRIDLLGLDKDANLVVIELKRTEDGGHMELQAIRYAAMVSTMTFEQAVNVRQEFQADNNIEGDPADHILRFLGWPKPVEEDFAQNVNIVLVSSDFSKELTTAVLWLNSFDLDIRCVRLSPYQFEDRLLLDVQQVVPLPEAAAYQIQVRAKNQKERRSREGGSDWTRYDVRVDDQLYERQYKRRAILIIVSTLVKRGISPERIAELIPCTMNRAWTSCQGTLDSDQFIESGTRDAKAEGKNFDAGRWFCDKDELLQFEDRTFAFSNQWGTDTPAAMQNLTAAYPEFNISVEPSPPLGD